MYEVAFQKNLKIYENKVNETQQEHVNQNIDYEKSILNQRTNTIKQKRKLKDDTFKPLIKLAKKRLHRNYDYAVKRLIAASEGLTKIYGHTRQRPDIQSGTPKTISDLVIWTRNAISFLIAYQQRDQSFTKNHFTKVKNRYSGMETI